LSVLCICNRRLIGPTDFVRPDDGRVGGHVGDIFVIILRKNTTRRIEERRHFRVPLVRWSVGRLITIPAGRGDGQQKDRKDRNEAPAIQR
jgi:hypothetical protein